MYIYNSLEIPVKHPWVYRILKEYEDFLISYHKEQKTVLHHLRNSSNVFIAMEQITPNELTYDWLESCFEKYGKAKSWKSLTGFPIRKKMIQLPSEDSKYKKQCMNFIVKVPANFQKCLEWYAEDKFALQERQIANNASSSTKSRTIETDMCSLFRMARWITEHYNEVVHWTDITDIYLMSIEMVLLKEYLLLRQTYPNQKVNSHLFIRRNRGDYLPDKAVAKTFARSAVQSFSGFGPQTLRITRLQEMAALKEIKKYNNLEGKFLFEKE